MRTSTNSLPRFAACLLGLALAVEGRCYSHQVHGSEAVARLPHCLTACADRSPRGLLVNIWFADSPNPSRYQLGNWLARLIVVHQRRLRLGEITPCEGCGGLCRLDDGGRRGVSVITLEVVSVTDTSAASPRSAPAGGVGAEQPGLACPDGVRLSLIMYRAGRQLDRGR